MLTSTNAAVVQQLVGRDETVYEVVDKDENLDDILRAIKDASETQDASGGERWGLGIRNQQVSGSSPLVGSNLPGFGAFAALVHFPRRFIEQPMRLERQPAPRRHHFEHPAHGAHEFRRRILGLHP